MFKKKTLLKAGERLEKRTHKREIAWKRSG
jgi:hypothetical protein